MPVIDSLIAAGGIAHDLTVVTRDVADMKQSAVKLFDPWSDQKRKIESSGDIRVKYNKSEKADSGK